MVQAHAGRLPRPHAARRPDLLPQGSIRIESVEVDGSPYHRFDAEELQVDLPDTQDRLPVRVTLSPVSEK